MTRVQAAPDKTPVDDVQPYVRGDRLIVIETGELIRYWETLKPHGLIETCTDAGVVRVYQPHEVRHADQPVEQVPSPEQVEARGIAEGLRNLADMIATNPDLLPCVRYGLVHAGIVCPTATMEDGAAALRALALAALRAGGKVTKGVRDRYFDLFIHFGPVKAQFIADRGEVCERVVTGTREVTEEVPDPEALAAVPKVAVTKTVEDVEWVCRPLLGDDTTTGGAE